MNNTEKFTGRADAYVKARPSYSQAFIKMLCEKLGFGKDTIVADIGSGTGKLSKQLLENGCIVYCVEPNEDMRAAAEKELRHYKDFHSVNGSASDTKLNTASVDFITVAQAFHWFNADEFKKECIRILKPHGKVILVWNTRDMESEFNVKSYEIYKKYCPDFKGYHGGMKDDDGRIADFFDNSSERLSFDNPLEFTKEKFINRSLSASYSLSANDKNFDEYVNELEKLFDNYSQNGIVIMENKTTAYIGEVK